MTWLDRILYRKVRDMWDNPQTYNQYLAEKDYKEAKASRMNTLSAGIERGNVEGQDRISFELSTAVGGRILNVRRYDQRKDYHDTQTYVIPSGEDVGARVAKIINLELIK